MSLKLILSNPQSANSLAARVQEVIEDELGQSVSEERAQSITARVLDFDHWQSMQRQVRLRDVVRVNYVDDHFCKACEQRLRPDGYCTDDQCFHHSWPQKVSPSDITSDTAAFVQNSDGTRSHRRAFIRARAFCRSNGQEAHFDAAPYFLKLLLGQGLSVMVPEAWAVAGEQGTGFDRRRVAMALAFADEELAGYRSLPDYKDLREFWDRFQKAKRGSTFDVEVNADDMNAWMRRVAGVKQRIA